MTQPYLTVHELLRLDADAAVDTIIDAIRDMTHYRLARRGAVVAVSGGIDSSLTVKLCALALGPEHVIGLLMPERESSEQTRRLSRLAAESAAVQVEEEDITAVLDACGCYAQRDAAAASVIPGYGPGWRCKLVGARVLESGAAGPYRLVAEGPDARRADVEPPIDVLRRIVAASNFKQRVRKMREYYHADLHNYAVAGTSNRMETELGFFVKQGDGAGDLKPIAHLYKTQIYQLARHLGLPDELLAVAPTPDTYPLEHDAEEFFFALPLAVLDLCLFCRNHRCSREETARVTGLTPGQVDRALADIAAKRAAAEYLRAQPLLVETAASAPPPP